MKVVMEHCDDKGMKHWMTMACSIAMTKVMEHCDDRGYGAL